MIVTFESVASTLCLIVVCVACIVHISANIDKYSAHGERWGFILTAAGSFGQAVYIWSPKIEAFPFELVFHVGTALIALTLIHGKLRALLAKMPGMRWTDRRTRT